MINRIFTKVGIFFLFVLSYLPLWFLYLIADFFYILLYRLTKYRVQVVRNNIYNSFPEKSAEQQLELEKKYYRYLADLIVESIKGFTISRKELLKRVRIDDVYIYDELYERKQSAIVVMGHNGNWEWASRATPLILKNQLIIAYKPLSNPDFDALMNKTRAESGAILVPMSQIGRILIQHKEPYLLVLLADQSPTDKKTSFWVRFLNQETAVLPGVEKLALKFKLPIIFHEVKRTNRGFYDCKPEYLLEVDKVYKPGEISQIQSTFLEQKIREQPETWLWSHKRWKLKND
jgi:KDO2-lipid IV(A) lauroyltransferase